ncbi:MAG: hypothetical protein HY460_00855 [Parcubacteria group bacterium]|nr:hypothetical protein [Parcubacteria group bacterium]
MAEKAGKKELLIFSSVLFLLACVVLGVSGYILLVDETYVEQRLAGTVHRPIYAKVFRYLLVNNKAEAMSPPPEVFCLTLSGAFEEEMVDPPDALLNELGIAYPVLPASACAVQPFGVVERSTNKPALILGASKVNWIGGEARVTIWYWGTLSVADLPYELTLKHEWVIAAVGSSDR